MGVVGGVVPPVACYPTTSQAGVPILCPHGEALGGCLAEDPIVLGGGAVVVGDGVAPCRLGTCLEGVASLAVGLCQVEQEGGTVGADHTGALEQQVGDTLGVTHEGGEAGGGDDGKHGSQGRGVVEVSPPRLFISYSIGRPCRGSGAKIGTVAQLAHGLGWGRSPC